MLASAKCIFGRHYDVNPTHLIKLVDNLLIRSYQTVIQRKKNKKHRDPMASLVHPCHQPHMLLLSVRDASLSMLKSSCCRKRSRSWNDPAVVRTDDGEIWRNMFPKLFDTSRKEIERTLQSIITVHMFLRYFFWLSRHIMMYPICIYIYIYPLSSLTCPRVRDQRVFAESLHITRETGSGAASIDRLADAEWDCSWVCWKCRINMDEPTQSW